MLLLLLLLLQLHHAIRQDGRHVSHRMGGLHPPPPHRFD